MNSSLLCRLYAVVLLASSCTSQQTIQRKYLAALDHQRSGRTLAATELWMELIQHYPRIAGPRTNMAIAEFERGRTEQANRLLRQELRLNDSVFAARYALGVVQYRSKKWGPTEHTARRLLIDHPSSPEANFLLACTKYKQGATYADVQVPLQVVLKHALSPDLQSRGYHLMGIAQLRDGQLLSGLQSIQRATELRRDAIATYNLAVAHVAAGDLLKADKALDAAEDLDPNAYQIPLLRAHIAVHRRQLDSARRYLTEALRRQPKRTAATLAISATIMLHSSAYEDARDTWRQVTRMNPNQAAYWTNLGLASLHCDDITGSLSAFKKAHALAPDDRLEHAIRQLQAMSDD